MSAPGISVFPLATFSLHLLDRVGAGGTEDWPKAPPTVPIEPKFAAATEKRFTADTLGFKPCLLYTSDAADE